MPAILRRLGTYGINLPSSFVTGDDDGPKAWAFREHISQNVETFKKIVYDHQVLSVEYSAHCALARELIQTEGQDEHNKTKIIRQLEAALILAELLEHIHQYYLMVPREVSRLRNEQTVYRDHLAKYGYTFGNTHIEPFKVTQSASKTIREQTLPVNLVRHMVARTRRLLVLITPTVNDSNHYSGVIGSMDHIVVPALSYAAWLFFVPRAFVNIWLTGKHVIPGSWMSDHEKALGWKIRFKSQMERRWFELGNDIAALVVNLLNCFLFVGAMTPIGLYVTAASLAYDVGLACLRAYIEISRLKKLEDSYKEMLAHGMLNSAGERIPLTAEEVEETNGYIRHLHERISYEQKRLYMQVMIAATLLIAFALTFPLFAFNPIIPIVGAAIAVLTTIAWYQSIKWVVRQKPADKVPAIPPVASPDSAGEGVPLLPVPASPQKPSGLGGMFAMFRLPRQIQSGSNPELAKFTVG